MSLQFHRAVEDMEIWSATGDGFSFVITYETLPVPAFMDASPMWRRRGRSIGVAARSRSGGLAFATFAEAEKACNTMLEYLKGLSPN